MNVFKCLVALSCCPLNLVSFGNKNILEDFSKSKQYTKEINDIKHENNTSLLQYLEDKFLSKNPEKNLVWQTLLEAKEGNALILNTHNALYNYMHTTSINKQETNLKKVFNRILHSKIRKIVNQQCIHLSEDSKRKMENLILKELFQTIDNFIKTNEQHYFKLSWDAIKEAFPYIQNNLSVCMNLQQT